MKSFISHNYCVLKKQTVTDNNSLARNEIYREITESGDRYIKSSVISPPVLL